MKNSNNNNNVSSMIKSLIALVMVSQLAACNFLVADAGLGGNGGQRNTETVNIANAADESENTAEKAEISIASIVLSWTAPSARADESPISMAEIASFRVYYATSKGEYSQYLEINDAYSDEVDLSEMITEAGTYYIVMTTIDTDGRESAYSQDIIIEV